ncbi:MAG: PP2C family protein-serine/threonine phosphatase [Parachlamydiales bacterium]|nr:PP2C family protein-serine/threonine phosphatase [Parachlamydiales bacterium]
MADSSITKKSHPSGSLARRILIIAILLLVIPLFLQTLFLYRQEYDQKLQDVEADLKMLANERAHFIDEILQMDWTLLEEATNESRNIERIPLPPNARDQFVAISKSRQAVLAGIAETPTEALVIPIPFTVIARDMPRAYQIRMALIDEKGKVLWENVPVKGEDFLQADDPIGETGLSVRLTVEKKEIKGLHQQSYYLRFAALVLFVGIIGGGAVFLFTRRIAKPLRHLCKTMERVSEGAAHVRYTPDWMGFEINALGIQFNQTLDGLLRHAGEAERERLHRERLAKELSIGHEIQSNLLPTHVPGMAGLDIASAYFASKEVNGDFYDLFKMPNGKLLISVCDTAGKGIPACLFALGLRSILRTLATTVHDLSELVQRANDLYFIDAQNASMFSTLWIGIFDPKSHKLTFCSQGHPPGLLVRGAQLEELWTQGIALGAQKVDLIPTKEVGLEDGDLLVLYTDGIVEAHDSENRLYGKNRFYEILVKKQKSTAQQLADRIIEEVRLFSGGAPQHDDMTLLVIRVKK